MNIIKLNATDSTNEFLKELKRETIVADYTVVSAEYQFHGKGQMGAKWISEEGKNLMISVLKKHKSINISDQFFISIAVANAVYHTLSDYIPEKLTIKWPNDILSDNQKIAGVLIENTIADGNIIDSVIGIGININQTVFSSDLKNVSSLKNILLKEVNKDLVLENLMAHLKMELIKVENREFEKLKVFYESKLYKKEIPTMFEDSRNQLFLGKIKGVSETGKLIVELENDQYKSFNIKEIKFL